MKTFANVKAVFLLTAFLFSISACRNEVEKNQPAAHSAPVAVDANASPTPQVSPSPKFPDLQAELLGGQDKTTVSPIGKFDFKNYIYPLPRGWQDADGKDAILENGMRRGGEKQIGLSYVTTKFGDVTGDSEDEAFVILKILTAGSANPQAVYVFTWKNEKPELIWNFRTGDRTDGGLKNLRMENGELIVELYGQDRFLLGDVETSKITGDEEQLCCPTFFTQTRYKWNGSNLRMQGKRETFSLADKNAPPQENLGDVVNKREAKRK